MAVTECKVEEERELREREPREERKLRELREREPRGERRNGECAEIERETNLLGVIHGLVISMCDSENVLAPA